MNNSIRFIIGLIIVAGVVILGVWLFSSSNQEVGPAAVGGALDYSGLSASSAPARLSVPDQFPGAIVYVKSVDLPVGGWVVIRERGESGPPGPVIGEKFFDAGVQADSITLRQPLIDGQSYVAVLHQDNGDKIWNESQDLVIKDASGAPIMVMFLATEDLPEEKG